MDHKVTGYLPLTPSNLAICNTLLKLFGGIFQLVKLSFLWWKYDDSTVWLDEARPVSCTIKVI